MGKVPKPNIRWRGAHPNNFTVGRPGASRDGRETFHHVVGSRESAVIVFNQSTRGASSHFVVGGDIIDQCVDIANTAWCDGNWESNLRTIAVEHEGGQQGTGPYSEAMYKNAIHLCAWLMDNYGVVKYFRHRDVSLKSTACPGGLDVERIWREAKAMVAKYNQSVTPPQPEWLKNRKAIPERTVYSHKDGLFIYNLNDGKSPADSRRFPINQNFLIKGETIVGGKKFYITKSSYDTAAANGIADAEVKDVMWTPPPPPAPTPPPPPPAPATPAWADAVVDIPNREMYVLRATPLIDLEFGKPYQDKNGKEVWYQAGDIIKDVSAHTVVAEVTYQLTEYAFLQIKGKLYQNANGIKGSDLTTDPKACPPGTPANPELPPPPDDPVDPMPDVPAPEPIDRNWLAAALQAVIAAIQAIIDKIKGGK